MWPSLFTSRDKADLNSVLPEIKVPTLLLFGEKDQRFPQHVAEKMHSSISDSKLVVIQGTVLRSFIFQCFTLNMW